MSPHEIDVLEANSTFYAAFLKRDFAAMERLWAQKSPVSCIHPGWNVLVGRDAVMAAWQGILGNDASPKISFTQARAHVFGESALVICREVLSEAKLVATNVFVREAGAWRLVHHQAAGVSQSAEEDDETGPHTLN
jgi:hypothetical protein